MENIQNMTAILHLFAAGADDLVEGYVGMLVALIVFCVMIFALLLPMLMIPYIFIKMGSIAGQVQAKINSAGRGVRKTATGAAKSGVKSGIKNSKYAQAWDQAKGVRKQLAHERGRRYLLDKDGPGRRLVGATMGQEGVDYLDKMEKVEQRKRVREHMDALRTEAPKKLHDIADDTGESVDRREAAFQLLMSQGHTEQVLALDKKYGVITSTDPTTGAVTRTAKGSGDATGQEAFGRSITDNFADVKKDNPTVVGKKANALNQDEILGMGGAAFDAAYADPTNDVFRAKFAAAYADPLKQSALKGHHTAAAKQHNLPGPTPPPSPTPTPPPGPAPTPGGGPSGGPGSPPPPPPSGP